jgi:hypothetical protein
MLAAGKVCSTLALTIFIWPPSRTLNAEFAKRSWEQAAESLPLHRQLGAPAQLHIHFPGR